MSNQQFPFADLSLARRLERTEALGNVDFVKARAKAFPESNAEWMELNGAYAMFDGVGSPVTQTFGLGMHAALSSEDLNVIEDFFRAHGAEIFHEVCPLADATVLSVLNERNYRPVEFSSVLYRPISKDFRLNATVNEKIRVRQIESNEHDLWARIAADGWSEYSELADFLFELGQVSAQRDDALCYLAELDNQPIATGVLSICEGVALLAGASTVPAGRQQGAQLALLEHRLRFAAEQGCDVAMMAALPGSSSQRNAERHGFRISYTRTKWQATNNNPPDL